MFDTRLSSVNDTWDWNRGRLILYYSSNHAWGGSGTDNNGNLIYAENWVPPPNATLDQAQTLTQDSYSYDALNRLSAINESSLDIAGGGSWISQFAQVYGYDRYGNRTIDQTNTWGTNIPKPNFVIDTNTNRLTPPAGYTMSYDAAGNLTTDTFTGEGTRTYDAENRMKQAWANNQWQTYTYDGDGHRVRRNVNGTETWQVYGIGGEVLAEYAGNVGPATPQKEYGYRNGQLLVTAESSANIHWLVTDQLGTPRMIADLSGSLSGVSRHDYLPFGEELYAGVGGRTTGLGYTGDNVREKFTQKERDIETGLDYFQHRYYESGQGRFTSPDPFGGSGYVSVPQSWNKYSYCLNRPFVFTDPSGLMWLSNDNLHFTWVPDDEYKKHRDQWKGYSEANGAIAQYSSSTACPECKDYKPGSWVQLNSNGTVSQVADPTTTIRAQYDEQVEDHQIYAQLGMTRAGGRREGNPLSGPPGGSSHIDYKEGGGQTRHYDQNGDPWVDIDYGHDHNGVGDPHVHWWDWNNPSDPRGEAEPLPWGWPMWDNGEYVPQPRGTSPMFPVYPMDVPLGVPFRPMVPLRPMIWEPVLVP
ncbi:MAG: hypothetical protein QOG23_4407 [Blastocatellia bacterium]|jgi:RHS repeat-associated protein|nr:hypothetical protein [Blastocatellia bacterium]